VPARVASAAEALAWEQATIEKGTPGRELMRRAGSAAAEEIARRFPDEVSRGVAILTGPGNNGGDGWIVARCMAERGIAVSVVEVAPPRTDEAAFARTAAVTTAIAVSPFANDRIDEQLVIDALLGTGSAGNPRGEIASAVECINTAAAAGATVAALDLPTGLDATTGDHDQCVRADLSLAFGTMKRGHLVSRDVCGRIVVLDIGFSDDSPSRALPILVDAAWVRAHVPRIPATAHKGSRKRVAIIGGGKGMAGATILAGEGALRSGAGLLRIVTDPRNTVAIHAGIPAAIADEWPSGPAELSRLCQSVDAIAVGPGLGKSEDTRDLVERVLLAWRGPVVLDADALNMFEGDLPSLAALVRGHDALITPHPAEAARLAGVSVADVLANRFELCADLSRSLGAAVLLKGTPTVVASPSGQGYVSAAGTAALATGGSGDVLTGIAVTLLAQMANEKSPTSAVAENRDVEDVAIVAGTCAAFIHGRAAELCGVVRGTTLDDVLRALPLAWNEAPSKMGVGILAELRAAA